MVRPVRLDTVCTASRAPAEVLPLPARHAGGIRRVDLVHAVAGYRDVEYPMGIEMTVAPRPVRRHAQHHHRGRCSVPPSSRVVPDAGPTPALARVRSGSSLPTTSGCSGPLPSMSLFWPAHPPVGVDAARCPVEATPGPPGRTAGYQHGDRQQRRRGSMCRAQTTRREVERPDLACRRATGCRRRGAVSAKTFGAGPRRRGVRTEVTRPPADPGRTAIGAEGSTWT